VNAAVESKKSRFYPETAFGGFSDIDGTVVFYARINALVKPDFVIVDFGCGRGSYVEDAVDFRRNLRCFKGRVSKVIGLDVDPAARNNPYVNEFQSLVPGQPWPVESESVNLIVCDFVIEHLEDPASFFTEARRVLTRGGYLCVRTPNANSYIGLASRIIPNRYHKNVTTAVQTARKAEDVFPTLYRCNTIRAVRRQMERNGFRAVVYGYEAEPSYLEFSTLAYSIGVLHQKFAAGFLRPMIFAFGQVC
jgi:SAM-dependent methyltransferase